MLHSYRAPALLVALLAGCSTGNPASPATSDAGADASTMPEEASVDGAPPPSEAGDAPSEASGPVAVSFAYTPQWPGVKKVEVVGGFGQSTDWSKTASFLALSASGGTWSGSAMLPPGTYLYVFRVTGDASAVPADTYERYAVDPLNASYASCPMPSPTFSKIDDNPCSQIVVTAAGAPAPATPVHVTGTALVDGSGAQGWMVVLEREEPKSHHYFANRVTVGKDGAFDVIGSAGNYRLQVQYPTLLSATDLDRDPSQLGALRRAISAAFPLATSPVVVPTPDLGFHDYGVFAPSGDAGSLPTAFTFETGEAHLDVYGGPGDGGVVEIGDPWFTSGLVTDGGTTFAGTFDTAQATQDAAAPGTRYMWGTEQPFGADASVAWTNQSMVLPIEWH